MKKIEIFGDSILKGIMYTGGRYRVYNGGLEDRLKSLDIELSRNCRIGSTVVSGLERMEKNFQTDDPDGKTILLEFGGNDSDFNWKEISENPGGDFLPHTTYDTFENTYGNAIRLVREKGGKPVISTIIPIDADKYLNFLGRYFSKDNILSWLGDVSALYRWQESYNRHVEQIAMKYDCPVLDIRDSFLRTRSYASLYCDDGIHPTEEGHRIIENTITDYFTV